MTAPAYRPLPGRHTLETDCPAWCAPERCVHGQIHVGTPIYWPSTVGDLEFSLSRYQADGQPQAYLFTMRALATVGTIEAVVSRRDLERFPVAAERLRNTERVEGEPTESTS